MGLIMLLGLSQKISHNVPGICGGRIIIERPEAVQIPIEKHLAEESI